VSWASVIRDAENQAGATLRIGDDIGVGCPAAEVIRELDGIESVQMVIDSGGGDLVSGMELVDSLRGRCPEAWVVGRCYSAAIPLLLAGERRIASTTSRLLVHRGHAVVAGGEGDLRKAADGLGLANGRLARFLETVTGQSSATVASWLIGDNLFSPEEALRVGLIHEIRAAVDPQEPARNGHGATVETPEAMTLLSILNAVGNVRCTNPDRVRREVRAWATQNLR
jgi:ATP-dependent protease ClpP protease subunit